MNPRALSQHLQTASNSRIAPVERGLGWYLKKGSSEALAIESPVSWPHSEHGRCRSLSRRPAVLPRSASLLDFAFIPPLDFLPECFMGNAGAFAKPLAGRFQDRLQCSRMTQEQTFQVFSVLGPKQDGHRFALARHDNGAHIAGLDICINVPGNFIAGSNVHNSTSSPPTRSLLPSFTPMA